MDGLQHGIDLVMRAAVEVVDIEHDAVRNEELLVAARLQQRLFRLSQYFTACTLLRSGLAVGPSPANDRIELFEGTSRPANDADLLVVVADVAILEQEIAQDGRRRICRLAVAIDGQRLACGLELVLGGLKFLGRRFCLRTLGLYLSSEPGARIFRRLGVFP